MLIRDIEETNEDYGKPPEKRTLKELMEKCLVILDKPAGPTSHQVTNWAKQILGAKKTGHSGTLDPKVTGVLPVAVNSATKIVPALLKAPKEYAGIMHVHGDFNEGKLRDVVRQFEGEIIQKPPVKSAVKRRARKRTIYYFKVLEIEGREVLFRTSVEAGTYIRKLCHDMGVAIGPGANMKELRRTKAGPFTEDSLVTLHELNEAWNYYRETKDEKLLRKILRPVEDGVMGIPKVYIKDSAVNSVTYGADLGVAGVSKVEESVKPGDLVAIMTLKGELVAIGRAHLDAQDMTKLWDADAVELSRVVMERDVYPKTW